MLDDANVPDANRIRVTFHPEYANCDFVGQILPTIEKIFDATTGEEKEIVKYIFNPGPFTLALERARKTNDMVYLIIEEINRGNAAAIFGDLFQLLDIILRQRLVAVQLCNDQLILVLTNIVIHFQLVIFQIIIFKFRFIPIN